MRLDLEAGLIRVRDALDVEQVAALPGREAVHIDLDRSAEEDERRDMGRSAGLDVQRADIVDA